MATVNEVNRVLLSMGGTEGEDSYEAEGGNSIVWRFTHSDVITLSLLLHH